jgi:hypothetical protein
MPAAAAGAHRSPASQANRSSSSSSSWAWQLGLGWLLVGVLRFCVLKQPPAQLQLLHCVQSSILCTRFWPVLNYQCVVVISVLLA